MLYTTQSSGKFHQNIWSWCCGAQVLALLILSACLLKAFLHFPFAFVWQLGSDPAFVADTVKFHLISVEAHLWLHKITSEQICLWRELISGSSAVIFRLHATVLPVSRTWHITKMYLKSYQNIFQNIVYVIWCWRSVILSVWSATWELLTSIVLTT